MLLASPIDLASCGQMAHKYVYIWRNMGEKKNACRILVGKPEGKRPLGRSRRRSVDLEIYE
jgi:hypothetical protein